MKRNNLLKIIGLSSALTLTSLANATNFRNCQVNTYDFKNQMVPICAQLSLEQLPHSLVAGKQYQIKWKQLNVNQVSLYYSTGPSQLDIIKSNLKIDQNTDLRTIGFKIPKSLKGKNIRFQLIGYHLGEGSVIDVSKRRFSIK